MAVARDTGAQVTIVAAGPEGRGREIADAVTNDYSGFGVPVTTVIRDGDPASVILDVAEEQKSDLIIVGNKGMTGTRRFLLSSVPSKVAHHSECAVLIVKTT